MRSRTCGGLYLIVAALVSSVALTLATASPAWANHKGLGGKSSRVGNVFNGPKLPPDHIDCIWVDGATIAYVCTGRNGYREPLSTPDGKGQLQAGAPAPKYDFANPPSFSCDKHRQKVVPKSYDCSYSDTKGRRKVSHNFRLDRMIIMEDPAD